MLQHLRANFWLLFLTVVVCCVLYPLVLWGVGATAFRHQAEGSLLRDDKGNVVGSRLIAQEFTGKEYFWPRPSAASYKADASGASNYGSSNPLLRARVAQQLGPVVKYDKTSPTKPGQPVGKDVEDWFKAQAADKPDFVARWASDSSAVAEQWVKDHADAVGLWLDKPADDVKANAGDVAREFFPRFAKKHPGTWPAVEEQKVEGKAVKVIKPAREGDDIQSYLFDPWLQAHQEALKKKTIILEPVPGDMVTTSGSGLDPHITLKNALYQLDRVAGAWAGKLKRDPGEVRKEIGGVLEQKAEAPLGGLVGVKLVNVLEVNLELRKRYGSAATASR